MDKLLEPLTIEQENYVLKDVGYSREQLLADVTHIKEWLVAQEHLPPSRLQEKDPFFMWLLTGCKGSVESVKKKLDKYYTIRSYSEIFDNRDPMNQSYFDMQDMCPYVIMPLTNPQGVRLSICIFADLIPEKFNYLELVKVSMSRSEIFIRQSILCSQNYVLVNCKGATPSIALTIKLSVLRDVMFLLENVYPFRIIKLAFINAPSFMELIVNKMIKPYLPKKIGERLHFTSGGADDLLNYFSPSMLPSDYCGDSSNPTLAEYNARWSKYECEHRDWYLNELSEKVDESKRIITDDNDPNSIFGVHGSLKKLVID